MTSFTAMVKEEHLLSPISDKINIDKLKTKKRNSMTISDPGSAITHFIGMIMAITGTLPLVLKAASTGKLLNTISVAVFMLSMILLYGASTTYHALDISYNVNIKLKRLDHCMIPVLIAGSYTPICLIILHNTIGYIMFSIVWSTAILAILFKLLWVTCPRWISSVLYIVMGWTCVLGFSQIINALPKPAFLLLLLGGILYTVGGVIYAIKLPKFNARHKNFGTHEIFHVFVMAGSACHYIMMFNFVATA